jgi:hypothetical protein
LLARVSLETPGPRLRRRPTSFPTGIFLKTEERTMTRPRKSSLQTALTALVLLAAALLVLRPGAAWAQQAATATVEGVVTDPQGAVVPNVKITVTSVETGLTREAMTDESGVYRVPLPCAVSLYVPGGRSASCPSTGATS